VVALVRHFVAMNDLATQADRLEAGVAAIIALEPRLRAGSPWPPAELYGTEAEASWGPHETLAHLEEMLPYWLGEVERIIEAPAGSTVHFGRTAEDAVRIGVIGRDRALPLRELLDRVQDYAARVARRMRTLTDAEAERLGTHPTRGGFAVAALFERFVTGHIEDHVAQLGRILDERGL
jgi:hypothetical protein